jgi:hypothetical protein
VIRNKVFIGTTLFVIALNLSACSTPNSPSDVVEEYHRAMAAKDDVLTVNLSCLAWEENAKADGAGFEGVEVSLKDASCIVLDEDGENATVSCSGKFVFQYAGGEIEEIGLERRNYSVIKEAGEWKMCGQPSANPDPTQPEIGETSTTPSDQSNDGNDAINTP